MQLENYLMSEKKWRHIVALLEKPGKVEWEVLLALVYRGCGHCKEFVRCYKCTLMGESLCDWSRSIPSNKEKGHMLLEHMYYGRVPRNKRKALSIARRIYNAILKDDPRSL